ncbi:TetR/AcrR family transcriptional regulator [Secundilactobacillus collinoides]|uniref:HTH tetR-type domain-containing protein n=1 Tax=Secundilactobacillus collinoides DSM 20515 = JCM 1123 TaxID=1423733 RepID=A0A0R2BF04_SECCO|nr:TetR/AcrR family transcriptional regulator [Secundilactobacillus collinoides]KRM74412.1 hypothetical protein FC82_GL000170 [Secundilactobacillus collinoides DSM 20515 = JCM 1123]
MDKRIERTQAAIEGAFLKLLNEKSISKITVCEVTSLAGVNRSTFYAHYHDVYDLKRKIMTQVKGDLDGQLSFDGPNLTMGAFKVSTMEMIDYLNDNRERLQYLLSTDDGNRFFFDLVQDRIMQSDTISGIEADDRNEAQVTAVVYGVAGLMRDWVFNRVTLTEAELTDLVAELAYPTVSAQLEALARN